MLVGHEFAPEGGLGHVERAIEEIAEAVGHLGIEEDEEALGIEVRVLAGDHITG